MASLYVKLVIPLLYILYLCTACLGQGKCGNGAWFGSNCQYRCNCKGAKCGHDGECLTATCNDGWFGLKCQYQNLFSETTTNSSNTIPGWLADYDDRTCNDGRTENLFLELKQEYPFNWLRLVLNDTAQLLQIKTSFAKSDKSDVLCINQRLYLKNRTADLLCEENILVKYINITGSVVMNLCSLYISGGRNIALKENTNQTSTYEVSKPGLSISSNAVDGNTNRKFKSKSCTHTLNEHAPRWEIKFNRSWIVSRFVIFNRDSNQVRLQNFILETFNEENMIEKYQDNLSTPQDIYTVINSKITPIQTVRIIATKQDKDDNNKIFVTICEFEAYADCNRGSWGLGCLETCSKDCPQSCHPDVGACETKCILKTDDPDCVHQESDVGIAIGLVIFIIIIVIAALIFFQYRRYKAQKSDNRHLSRSTSTNSGPLKKFSRMFSRKESVESMLFFEINEEKDLESHNKQILNEEKEAEDMLYCTQTKETCIATTELNIFLRSRDREFFSQQFKAVPEPDNVSTIIGLNESNKAKNRYKNIITYDHSRVNLQVNIDSKESDYINASYIKGHKNEVRFIASQGPTKTMINDFIRMIWEQKTDNIVMLTSLVENGKIKCEQYWSNKGKTQYGNIKVRLCSTETFADYSIRRLELSKKDEPCHKMTQFHFDTWPDKNVPLTPWGLVEFQNRVWASRTSKPIVVHCSAGVGRTGTFIALCNVMEQARETGRVNFFEILSKLRQDRMWMVQNVEQYEFLHHATQVALLCLSTFCDVSEIIKVVNCIGEKTVTGNTKLDQEYKNLCEVCEAVEKQTEKPEVNSVYNQASEEESIYLNSDRTTESSKNRSPGIIPNENFRVVLNSDSKHLGEYINAIFIQGIVSDSEIILTQLPMPGTVVDFWRMIVQYKVTLVVAFEVDSFDTDKSVAEYLPSNTEQVNICPPFRIHSAYMKKSDLWEERKLTIHKQKLDNHRLIHLQSKLPDLNDKNLLTFMKQVKSYESKGRTVYMCRNGATYCGLACILSILLDRIDRDLSVSVPLTTGAVKSIRSQVISSVEQYKCLYDVLGRYTDTSDQYHNVTEDLFQRNKTDQKNQQITDGHRDSTENKIYFNQ